MKEFKTGDRVFWATYENREVKEDCPVCFGKKEVFVILGNDEKVKTECDYCNVGFSGARGFVEVYKFIPSVSEIIIEGKEINENSEGRFIEYRYKNYCLRSNENIFKTKKEAEIKVSEMIKERIEKEENSFERRKNGQIMKLTWSVGYHQRNIREAEKQIKHHSSKVELVKKIIKETK